MFPKYVNVDNLNFQILDIVCHWQFEMIKQQDCNFL